MPTFSRRALLRGAGAVGVAVATGLGHRQARATATPGGPSIEGSGVGLAGVDLVPPAGWDYPAVVELLPFAHGVASGDPLADRVVLWTRITVPDVRGWDVADPQGLDAVDVDWIVASDPALRSVVARGQVTTTRAVDWTVKVDPAGLPSATTLWYAFAALGRTSPVGRTRTAPAPGDGVAELRFVNLACTSWWSTTQNAYARIAERNDVDLLLHAGDHVYEFVDDYQWYRARGGRFDETDVDFREWETADECRRRYALHYADPDILRAHQALPWAVIVDNHDVDDHRVDDEVVFSQAEASEVFWEWTPSRPPLPDGSGRFGPPPAPGEQVPVPRGEAAGLRYRALPYGDLAHLALLDMRSFRTPSRATLVGPPTDPDPAETILGAAQETWLQEELSASRDRGAAFRVLLNGVNMSQLRAFNPPIAAAFADLGFNTSSVGAIYPNGWDEWPEARRRLFEWLRAEGIVDNVVLSGDAHGWFASDLVEDNQLPSYEPLTGGGLLGAVGVELQPGGGGRKNGQGTLAAALWEAAEGGPAKARYAEFQSSYFGLGLAPTVALEEAGQAANPNLRLFQWRTWGYGLVHLTASAATIELWEVPMPDPSADQRLLAAFRSPVGAPHLFPVLVPEATTGGRIDPPPPSPLAVADPAVFGLRAEPPSPPAPSAGGGSASPPAGSGRLPATGPVGPISPGLAVGLAAVAAAGAAAARRARQMPVERAGFPRGEGGAAGVDPHDSPGDTDIT